METPYRDREPADACTVEQEGVDDTCGGHGFAGELNIFYINFNSVKIVILCRDKIFDPFSNAVPYVWTKDQNVLSSLSPKHGWGPKRVITTSLLLVSALEPWSEKVGSRQWAEKHHPIRFRAFSLMVVPFFLHVGYMRTWY